MKLSICIHQFFGQYLPRIKGVSTHTIKAYRDSFKIFLPFAAKYHGIKIDSLNLEHLSSELILAFLDELERGRKNLAKTRNDRLASLKSFAKMIRFMYPEKRQIAEKIGNLPQKRTQKPLIGFLYQEEILKVFQSVDLKRKDGLRDYTLLHLLYDSGARASEVATLNLDYFNPQQKTLVILGKWNRYRLIELEPKTVQLLQLYIRKYRTTPRPLYQHRLFINQRGEELTRHGIYRICKKYLSMALPAKRLKLINPVHSFRHSCAVNMLYRGDSLSEIRNHLGHEDIQSTSIYLHLDLNRKREIQKKFIEYMQSVLTRDPKIEELLDWENKEDIITWLDSL
ncbi:MAG: tyrosine-type recombinase/integrase [Desulfobacteraceae bacterium]|nr:tyrosine-type recombinase/integrase [Desulfobacteraceae bacterium]